MTTSASAKLARPVDLLQMRTFVAAAREQSLTRAAKRLAMSQPAASAHIRALEEQLGLVLFDRTNRGLKLTSVGQALLRQAEGVLELALSFSVSARELREGTNVPIYIGSNVDPSLSRFGEFIIRLQTKFPLMQLHIHLQSSHATRQSIQNGELDAGFLLGTPADDKLTYLRLSRVVYRVVGPSKWHDTITNADRSELAHMPWIVTPPGNAHSDLMKELFFDHGLEPRQTAEVNNEFLIRSLVKDGIGLSLIRENYALEAEATGTMSISPKIVMGTNLLFAYPRERENERLICGALEIIDLIWSARAN